mmetsp:Transcript_100084/g.322750  ORF Transcript_100084/g.322750 Transcript_100084/m.322750 type:complete len:256 (-) Transcript_100084:55-822(-)
MAAASASRAALCTTWPRSGPCTRPRRAPSWAGTSAGSSPHGGWTAARRTRSTSALTSGTMSSGLGATCTARPCPTAGAAPGPRAPRPTRALCLSPWPPRTTRSRWRCGACAASSPTSPPLARIPATTTSSVSRARPPAPTSTRPRWRNSRPPAACQPPLPVPLQRRWAFPRAASRSECRGRWRRRAARTASSSPLSACPAAPISPSACYAAGFSGPRSLACPRRSSEAAPAFLLPRASPESGAMRTVWREALLPK